MRHLLTSLAAAALRRGFGICNCPRPCRSAPATKRPWQSGLAGRKGRSLRVPPLRLIPASPLLLASPVLPALLRIWLLPAVSLWLLEPALLSALVVVFCPGPVGLPPVLIAVSRRTSISPNKR
jgi:hypothetical protein